MFAGSIVPGNDKIGIARRRIHQVLRLFRLASEFAHQEELRVWKASGGRTDEHQITHICTVAKWEIEGDFTTVRTGDKSGVGDFTVVQKSRQVFGFVIRFRCRWRKAISATVVTDRVEPLAECGPNIIPNGRIYDAVVHENDSIGSRTAFLIV